MVDTHHTCADCGKGIPDRLRGVVCKNPITKLCEIELIAIKARIKAVKEGRDTKGLNVVPSKC